MHFWWDVVSVSVLCRSIIYVNWTIFIFISFSIGIIYSIKVYRHIKMLTTSKSVCGLFYTSSDSFRDGHSILFLFHRKFIDMNFVKENIVHKLLIYTAALILIVRFSINVAIFFRSETVFYLQTIDYYWFAFVNIFL